MRIDLDSLPLPSSQPPKPDPAWPRYSARPFPPYAYVPGRTPHPRRDPKGYGFGQPEPHAAAWTPDQWQSLDLYLYGIDCHNHAYWWECHEALEALWHAAGHTTPHAQFLQGLIQVAAGNLQRFLGAADTARGLAFKGLARTAGVSGIYMGVDVRAFEREVRDYYEGRREAPASIRLKKE